MKVIFSLLFLHILLCEISGMGIRDSISIELNEIRIDADLAKPLTGPGKVLHKFSETEIKQIPAQTVDAFMKFIPGVDVRQRSVGGTQADMSIRGGSFDQVLVLLNGVNITDQQTGHHNLNIPIELTEVARVEILQGSASRKYGSQAFSGAVNIITDPQTKNKVDVFLTGGSFNTYSQKLTLAARSRSLSHFTSFSHYSGKGYRPNTDYDTYNLFSHTKMETAKAGEFDFQLGYQHKSFGANSFYTQRFPNQYEHTQTLFSSLNWEKVFRQLYLSGHLHYRRHYDRFELFRDFKGKEPWYQDHNYHLTDVFGGAVQVEYLNPLGKFSGGVSSRYDHIYSTVLGEAIADTGSYLLNPFEKKQGKRFNKQADRLVNTVYLDYSKSFGSFYLSAGMSASYSKNYGAKYHWGTDAVYLIARDFSLYAAVNTASRLPTFTDLYYQSATQTANPKLKAESSFTSEAGIKYHLKRFYVQGNAFHRIGSDIIDWVKYPGQEKWESMNLTGLNTSGLQVSTGYTFEHSFLKNIACSWSFIHTDKQAKGYDSKYALDYLRHQLIFRLHHQLLKNVTLNWNAIYNDRAGGYSDFETGEPMHYKPYLLANCRIAWENYGFLIYLDANNLLNTQYVDFGGLPQPGIHGSIGFRWRLPDKKIK